MSECPSWCNLPPGRHRYGHVGLSWAPGRTSFTAQVDDGHTSLTVSGQRTDTASMPPSVASARAVGMLLGALDRAFVDACIAELMLDGGSAR